MLVPICRACEPASHEALHLGVYSARRSVSMAESSSSVSEKGQPAATSSLVRLSPGGRGVVRLVRWLRLVRFGDGSSLSLSRALSSRN